MPPKKVCLTRAAITAMVTTADTENTAIVTTASTAMANTVTANPKTVKRQLKDS